MSKSAITNALHEALHRPLTEGILPDELYDRLDELLTYVDEKHLFYALLKWLPNGDVEKFIEDMYKDYDIDYFNGEDEPVSQEAYDKINDLI